MDPLTIIATVSRLVTVIQAIAEAAPQAVETIEAATKAIGYIRNLTSAAPEQVPQSEVDAANAYAEQLEADILNSPDAPQ